GSIAMRTSRVSITSPPVPNTVPISNARGSKPRSFQRVSAAAMPVASSGPSVSTMVHSTICAGLAFSTVTVQASPVSVSTALPPAPSGRTATPPRAELDVLAAAHDLDRDERQPVVGEREPRRVEDAQLVAG